MLEVVTNGSISKSMGMVLGSIAVLSYTTLGGMMSVAIIDLVQMVVIIIGLIITVYFVVESSGGVAPCIKFSVHKWQIKIFSW